MSEWSNEPAWKAGVLATVPRVRIPLSPPLKIILFIMPVKDSNGNELKDGDSVILIKSLPVKGSSVTLKKGMVIKNIRLTDDENEIDCKADKMKVVLKTCFVRKG